MTSTGKVWLVGAGPGDPELLTLKAVRAIAGAEVLLVDDLVNPEILAHASADARIVPVGKRGGCREGDGLSVIARRRTRGPHSCVSPKNSTVAPQFTITL